MTDPEAVTGPAASALASVHTHSFLHVLRQLGASVLVSTYQAGRLVVLRADGDHVNTHFRTFDRPMGLAADRERLAVGTRAGIVELRNMPATAPRLADPPRHDAVYLTRRAHVTGAIDVHEMGYAEDGRLWFVNTLFSCLCTLDDRSSFVPRWRPPWVSHYAPEDRCHLNGLGLRDGEPRYVTALGMTNTPEGWRANKRDGGVLVDIRDGRVVADRLSMPHSPRWHAGSAWVLESGRGALVAIDPQSGHRRDVARVPGFARGLDFAGPLAFVGLSQLRESNAFTDIPITEDNSERLSGVWVIDIERGTTIALLKFTGGVQEIFAVQLLAGMRFPDIVIDGDLLSSAYALPDDALREVRFTASTGSTGST